MLDFCYFSQATLLVYLHMFPDESAIFKLVFTMANGPLTWGGVLWRNALVFHDIDKLTSTFIHFYPALVTYCVRWYSPPADIDAEPTYFSDFYILPGIMCILWQWYTRSADA